MNLKETRYIIGRGRLGHFLDFGEYLVEELPARNDLPRVIGTIPLHFFVRCSRPIQPELFSLEGTLIRFKNIGAEGPCTEFLAE